MSDIKLRNLMFYQTHLQCSGDTDSLLQKIEHGLWDDFGQYSLAFLREGRVWLIRDPLGLNKMFFVMVNDECIVANRLDTLLKCGASYEKVRSCPPGTHLEINHGGVCDVVSSYQFATQSVTMEGFDLEDAKQQVRLELEKQFLRMAERKDGVHYVVCLSGGLDSSVIAGFSQKYLGQVSIVSFSFLTEEDYLTYLRTGEYEDCESLSEDFRSALRIAQKLGLMFHPVFRTRQMALVALEQAIVLGQDWRDFNVHCALMNVFLAEQIRSMYAGEKVIVLTGDLMNEYVCDYHEELIDGKIYYPQPKMSLGRRRKFFIRGLDAGDREIGVFSSFNLGIRQLYSVVCPIYLGVPESLLAEKDIKEKLNLHLVNERIVDCVNKVKQRAQVGGTSGGVLRILHDYGFDQKQLLNIWKKHFCPNLSDAQAESLIEIGRYRS